MPENQTPPAPTETTPALKAAIMATGEQRKTAKKPGRSVAAKPVKAAKPAKPASPAASAPAPAAVGSAEASPQKAGEAAPAPVAPAPESPKPAKTLREKKAKLVRDSFTMPEDEYVRFAEIKKRCLKTGHASKKSEILRAALATLNALDDAALLAALQGLDVIKTGRPRKRSK